MRIGHLTLALSLTLGTSACGAQEALDKLEAEAEKAAESSSGSSGVDASAFESLAAARMNAVLAKPSVTAAFDNAWAKIGADPEIAAAGEGLLSGIGSHPEFSEAANGFIIKLQGSQAFLKLLEDYTAQNPGLGPDQVAAEFGNWVSQRIERPEAQGAIDGAVDELMKKQELVAAIEKLTHTIAEKSGIADQVSGQFTRKLTSADTLAKLETKIGVKAGDPDFEQKLFDYLTEEERIEKFMIGFAELFASHKAPKEATLKLLTSKSVLDSSATHLKSMVEEPEFFPKAEKALVLLIGSDDQAAMTAAVTDLATMPKIAEAAGAWFGGLADLPEVEQGFAEAFRAVVEDPAFDTLIEDTFVNG